MQAIQSVDVKAQVTGILQRVGFQGGQDVKEGALLYFHRNAMLSGNFDDLRRGHEVYYVDAMGDTGPIASKVRVKKNATNGVNAD